MNPSRVLYLAFYYSTRLSKNKKGSYFPFSLSVMKFAHILWFWSVLRFAVLCTILETPPSYKSNQYSSWTEKDQHFHNRLSGFHFTNVFQINQIWQKGYHKLTSLAQNRLKKIKKTYLTGQPRVNKQSKVSIKIFFFLDY